MDKKFLAPYSPSETEDRIYRLWEESGFFNPDVCVERGVTSPDAEPFSIVLPPPNVTGTLHLGHALENSLQDAFVRFARMRGKRTLWLPGTDHAAIATESKVEKLLLKEEKRSRHDLGREAFLERVKRFAQESHDTIVHQVRKMGASLDWSREAYTLDQARSHAVATAFKQMYDAGLIYRGHRIVNWDPKGQTVISDDEVIRKEETTKLYYLQYGPFTITTARPETKFGDKYVVVHPDDKRYRAYGDRQQLELEWINGPVIATVIKDEAIDMTFGTGAMTITPWHDLIDFEIAERHNLEKEQIIDRYGKLLPIAEEFAGMKIAEARERIVEKLKAKDLVEKVEEGYVHSVATAERTGGLVEPQIMEQWFVAVDREFPYPHDTLPGIKKGEAVTLKHLMRYVVEAGEVEILPERFEKVYYHWIDNLRDWCISRQIWYGHRIPIWYRVNSDFAENFYSNPNASHRSYTSSATNYKFSIDNPGKLDGTEDRWIPDTDTLDTWFSSALWTFSTLGWPLDDARGKPTLLSDGTINPDSDLGTYHPTSVMDPAYEILFFWVARMILMSTYLLGEIPFQTVYLHGILRDAKGQKFSKSLGTGGDPLEIIERYGADALRMALIVGIGPGNDSRFDEEKVKAYKKFANKLWNVARFVLENGEGTPAAAPELTDDDRKLLDKLTAFTKDVTGDLETYKLYLASEKIYHYVWHTFADVILESHKDALAGSDERAKRSAQWTLLKILTTSLKLLHPFMPFVTEEIWQHLPAGKAGLPHRDAELLMVSKWPV